MEINFVGVNLLSFGRKPKGGGIAAFSADFTKTVAGKLEIEDIGDSYKNGTPDIELDCSEFTLSSKEGDLAKWTYTIKAQAITGVQVERYERENRRGKGFRHVIFFKIKFADLEGCKCLEEYMTHLGENKGILTATCSKPPIQSTIEEAEERDNENQNRLPGIAEE